MALVGELLCKHNMPIGSQVLFKWNDTEWRRKEVDHIDKTLSGANRKAALCDLMDRQAQLIHCIGLRRLEIADDLHLHFVESFLNKVRGYLYDWF